MARAGLQFWHLVVIVLLAGMLGTALGDIFGKAFPDSAAGRFLSAGITVGTTTPWDLDLRVVTLTAGVVLRLTVLGAAAAIAALVIFFRRL
ncbi:MAG: hypothetical protein AUI52_00325 [Acidobacteria bacterium 13_1_40CM_2_68_10]|nr:MAG: hypothetical protein AUI52_00325 [Acidobacteria bacterium 13_1_40CM_2_68_10]OLE64715.1 MAG: hypothetical protein AUG03_08190 [Acidobacteria bacterium 13_1_20CM_2_68_14]